MRYVVPFLELLDLALEFLDPLLKSPVFPAELPIPDIVLVIRVVSEAEVSCEPLDNGI